MPFLEGLEVIRSPIHGYGIIATRDFKCGDVLMEIDGFVWDPDKDDLDDMYSLDLEDNFFDMLDQSRWVNHSCDPNAEIEGEAMDQESAWAHLIAIKDIRKGEEITYDYAFSAEVAEKCLCRSGNCRGFIVDENQIKEVKI